MKLISSFGEENESSVSEVSCAYNFCALVICDAVNFFCIHPLFEEMVSFETDIDGYTDMNVAEENFGDVGSRQNCISLDFRRFVPHRNRSEPFQHRLG